MPKRRTYIGVHDIDGISQLFNEFSITSDVILALFDEGRVWQHELVAT